MSQRLGSPGRHSIPKGSYRGYPGSDPRRRQESSMTILDLFLKRFQSHRLHHPHLYRG